MVGVVKLFELLSEVPPVCTSYQRGCEPLLVVALRLTVPSFQISPPALDVTVGKVRTSATSA